MRDYLKKHKNEIIVGVIVFFITTLLGKIGNWFVSTTPKIGSSIVETILNITYTLAATRTINSLIIAFFGGLLGIFLGSIIPVFRKALAVFTSTLKLEQRIKALPNEAINELNRQVASDDSEPCKKGQSSVNGILKDHKRTSLQIILACAFLIVICFFIMMFVLVPANLHEKFDRDITIIHPYVEEQQVFQLKSDWVLMRSKADYISIYEYINMVKEKNDLLR